MKLTDNVKSDKILVLGIDGMDPDLTVQHLKEGIMPNLQKFIDRGAARADLHMLGSNPPVTPAQWTTLATGANPYVHGITSFWNVVPDKLDCVGYALDSRMCKAEQLWNVFAEAGKKTVVWHWPGSSWPPSSDSENLIVVDGTQPEGVNMGTGQVNSECFLVGNVDVKDTTYKVAAGDGGSLQCVITDLEVKETDGFDSVEYSKMLVSSPEFALIAPPRDLSKPYPAVGTVGEVTLDLSVGKITEPKGWVDVPEGAKESTILFSKGLVRRPVLILKNEQGIYDKIAFYKNKKATEPLYVLEKGVFMEGIIDEAIKNEHHYEISRNMRILDLAEDGTSYKIWSSAELNLNDSAVWSPRSLQKEILDNVGPMPPVSNLGYMDHQLISECMMENWMRTMKWQADSLLYMIEEKGAEIIFSQSHNDDAQKHMFIQGARGSQYYPLPKENYVEYLREISRQNDYYIGRFLHLLDEDWTIMIVSDHGLTCNMNDEMSPFAMSNVETNDFVEWGFTALKKDENGNEILPRQIDWEHTKAVKTRFNDVYINLKGKYSTGIVEPEDKWDLEDEIITKLYEKKSITTGKRMVELAIRNKDAYYLGLGGPDCGDIILFTADGFNMDHTDGLATTIGVEHTTMSPIFIAAGKGIKKGFVTERVIRETDVAPTMAVLAGVRMPNECEGAPVYQIIED